MAEFPPGTVTFLFTDIESSTKLWEKHPEEMQTALAQHDSILKKAIETNLGQIIKTTGDGVHAVFATTMAAVNAALDSQRALHALFSSETSGLSLKVRIGLHTGEARFRDGDYYGQSLNRAARIMSIAHGGQVLLSETTARVAREHLPHDITLLELGQHYLKDLARPEGIYQLVANGLQNEFPPINSLSAATNNLPIQLTSFVGRENEISAIQALLQSARLVTLTGSGGTGKTRLALEVGAQELASFANGIWLVELAILTAPAQIIPALAQTFGLQEIPFRPLISQLIDYLRDKQLLLILDNCEHLIDACASLADDLLRQSLGLKILATSREALGIAGEMSYRTPSLASTESTRLFIERARAANSNFIQTDSNAASVAHICSRLDGIPLAIELAAVRTRLLSPIQIAARLDDLFRLLVGGSRTALPRQQTLRALIDWSYDLLSEEEQQLLRTASVFVGGWTLDTLEAVSADPAAIEHLEALVNKSLVVPQEHGSEMRYFMLETIRQYAREKLFAEEQSSAARDRHFVYFNNLSENMRDAFSTQYLLPLVNRANDEVENFRAALEWGLENYTQENVRLAGNFCLVTSLLGIFSEGVAVARTAVERARALPSAGADGDLYRQKLIARALFAQGMVGMGVGNLHFVIQVLKESIALSRLTADKQILGYSLEMYYIAANLAFSNSSDADEAAREGFHIFTHEIKDSFGLGMAYMNMARIAVAKGDQAEKETYFEKLRERISETPGSFQVGMFFLGMGMDEKTHGNYAVAKKHFEDGLAVFKGISNQNFQLVLKSELGHLERLTGNLSQARLVYRETIKDWQLLGNRSAMAHQLECFAFLAIAEEEPQRAAKLFGAAQVLRENAQSPMTDYEQIEYDHTVAQLRAMLPEPDFTTLWSAGRTLPPDQAIHLAL